MTSIDISPLLQTAVGLGAAALFTFGSLALKALAARFNIQVSQGQQDLYENALNKGLSWGATQEMDALKAHGWDHVQTQSAVVANALNYVVAREPAALAGVGLSPTLDDPKSRVIITQALTRKLPAAFTALVASPATPPEKPPSPVSPSPVAPPASK